MAINRNKLYFILFIACFVGYVWLYFGLTLVENNSFEVCFIKQTTNIPCPSCGSTRSVISLLHGNFIDALKMNPLGYIVAMIMIVAPFWVIFDVAFKKKSLFSFYKNIESFLKKPRHSIPLILLLIMNWIWNILKGL
jgi:hypothetical protein